MQSTFRASGSEHPCMRDPSNASHWFLLHLEGHIMWQPGEYVFAVQP